MKNFSIAFVVFIGWCGIGVYFLDASGALNRKSLFSSNSSVTQNATYSETDTTFLDDSPLPSDFGPLRKSSYIDSSLTKSNNEQYIETLKKSIEQRTRAIEKDQQRLRAAENKSLITKKPVNVRKFDILYYPEFSLGGRLIQDQKASNFLEYIRGRLQEDPKAKIKIVGHTDYVGSDIDNYKTALEWANKVKIFILTSLKIPDYQISAYSSGENDPIFLNTGDESEKNNRIEVIIE